MTFEQFTANEFTVACEHGSVLVELTGNGHKCFLGSITRLDNDSSEHEQQELTADELRQIADAMDNESLRH